MFRRDCVKCKILAKKAIEVAMGQTHHSNLNIAPAFYMTEVDIFGPDLASYVIEKGVIITKYTAKNSDLLVEIII